MVVACDKRDQRLIVLGSGGGFRLNSHFLAIDLFAQ
jgi:hypothetical protein